MLKSLDMLILPALNESHPVKYHYNINVTIIKEEEPGASKKERSLCLLASLGGTKYLAS